MENEICNIGENKENKNITETLIKKIINNSKKDEEQQLKREWDEYFNYDFLVKSINNGIDINNLGKYSVELEARNQLMEGIDLKMSNQITFSFKFKEENILSDNEDYENNINFDNMKFTEGNDDDSINQEKFNNNLSDSLIEEISKKFISDIINSIPKDNCQKQENKKRIKNYIPNGSVEIQKDNLNLELDKKYLNTIKLEISFSIIKKKIEDMNNNYYLNELKKKDKIIHELSEKNKKLQNSNNILSDENKKLLELVNIFKMMSDIDKKNISTSDIKDIESPISKINESPIKLDEPFYKNIEKNNSKINNSNSNNNIKIKQKKVQTPKKEIKEKINSSNATSKIYNSSNYNNSRHNTNNNLNNYSNYNNNNSNNSNYKGKNLKNSKNKIDTLTNDYSNSYLFQGVKSYITIETPNQNILNRNKNIYQQKPQNNIQKKIPLNNNQKSNIINNTKKKNPYLNLKYNKSNLYGYSDLYNKNNIYDNNENESLEDIENRLKEYANEKLIDKENQNNNIENKGNLNLYEQDLNEDYNYDNDNENEEYNKNYIPIIEKESNDFSPEKNPLKSSNESNNSNNYNNDYSGLINRLNNYKNELNNENYDKNILNQNLPCQITNNNKIKYNQILKEKKGETNNDTATFTSVKKTKKNLKSISSNINKDNNKNEEYYNNEDIQYIPFQMMEKEKLYKNIVISQYGKV